MSNTLRNIATLVLGLTLAYSPLQAQETLVELTNILCEIKSEDDLTPRRSSERVVEDTLTLYFNTGKADLSEESKEAIRTYIKTRGPGTHLTIEGHADYRGSTESNMELSKRRADVVAEYAREYISGRRTTIRGMDTFVYGESKSSENLRESRKTVIIPHNNTIERGLDINPADVYLIDASSSMRGEKWSQVSSYQFPEGSALFTYTTHNNNCDLTLGSIRPSGSTPLWAALYQLVDQTASKKTITVITDGEDTVGQRTYEETIAAARKKGIRINVIGTNVQERYAEPLRKLTTSTGGALYMRTVPDEEVFLRIFP